MRESSTEPVIRTSDPIPPLFSDLDGKSAGERRCAGAVWRWIRPRRRVDHVALRNIRQPNLATTS